MYFQSTDTGSTMPDTGPTGSSSMATRDDAPMDDVEDSGEIAGRGETNRVIGGYVFGNLRICKVRYEKLTFILPRLLA